MKVDHAAKAREENQEEKARLLLQHRKRITMELHAILESVDTDASGASASREQESKPHPHRFGEVLLL
eukprot:3616233-Amphidinium_carterae.1